MNACEVIWFEHQKVGIWDVNENGEVFRYKQRANNPLGWEGVEPQRIFGATRKRGYFQVGFNYRDHYYSCAVHRLVYLRHVGDIPHGMQIDHIDYNPSNNALSNLRLVTPAENKAHSEEHRLAAIPKGEQHWHATLNPDKVRQIRTLYRGGVPVIAIADAMSVKIRAVYAVLEGKTWSHVQDESDGEPT